MHLPYEHVSLREGLRRGRSHLLFLAALAVVMALIVALDGIAPEPPPQPNRTEATVPEARAPGSTAPTAPTPRDSTLPASTPVQP